MRRPRVSRSRSPESVSRRPTSPHARHGVPLTASARLPTLPDHAPRGARARARVPPLPCAVRGVPSVHRLPALPGAGRRRQSHRQARPRAADGPRTRPARARPRAARPLAVERADAGDGRSAGDARGRRHPPDPSTPTSSTAARPASRVPPTASSARDPTGLSRVGAARYPPNIPGLGTHGARSATRHQVRATSDEIHARPAGAKRATLQARSIHRATQFRGITSSAGSAGDTYPRIKVHRGRGTWTHPPTGPDPRVVAPCVQRRTLCDPV